MKSILITDKLDNESTSTLKYGLDWAHAFNYFPYIIHVDKFADIHSYDHVFAGLNLEIQSQYIERIKKANDERLGNQLKKLNVNFEELKFETLAGDPATEIAEFAQKPEIDLIVLGNDHRETLEKVFLGSVIEKIIQKTDKSVLIVKDNDFHSPQNILVPFDFSEHCYYALDRAITFARKSHARITLINFISCYYDGFYLTQTVKDGLTSAMTEMIEQSRKELTEKFDELLVQKEIRDIAHFELALDHQGSISDSIMEYSDKNNNDLIIMGSHKRGKILRTFLGSVSYNMVRKTKVPILITK